MGPTLGYATHTVGTSSEATEPGRGQVSVLICASSRIDSLAHTVQDAIPRYEGHKVLHRMIYKLK
jgi:hypothetical protein